MERRLGRIQARHPPVNDLYEVALRDTPQGVRLHWTIKEDRQVWRGLREGAYMLRTNLQAGTAEDLWSRYMQLTVYAASPNPPPSRNPSCSNSASAYPNGSNSIANVVQTRR